MKIQTMIITKVLMSKHQCIDWSMMTVKEFCSITDFREASIVSLSSRNFWFIFLNKENKWNIYYHGEPLIQVKHFMTIPSILYLHWCFLQPEYRKCKHLKRSMFLYSKRLKLLGFVPLYRKNAIKKLMNTLKHLLHKDYKM